MKTRTTLAVMALLAMIAALGSTSCGSDDCSPVPCPYPGFDTTKCACSTPELPPGSEAGAAGESGN